MKMSSFFQTFLPQVRTSFVELRENGDQVISHGQPNLSCIEAKYSNIRLNREDDEREMGAANSGAPRIVGEELAPWPIQPFSGLDSGELLQAFFCGKSARTIESYRRDLQTFCEFLEVPDIAQAVKSLFSGTHRDANLVALKYR